MVGDMKTYGDIKPKRISIKIEMADEFDEDFTPYEGEILNQSLCMWLDQMGYNARFWYDAKEQRTMIAGDKKQWVTL